MTFLYRAMSNPKADEPDPVEPDPALTEVNAMLLRGPSKGDNDTLPKQTVIISSTKELQDYLESIYEMEYFGGIAPDKYTDAYFVNNVLLLTPVKVCGSGPGFTIISVTEKEDQIEVELAKPGDPETPDMCAWVLLIEAAKSMPEREIVIHTTYGGSTDPDPAGAGRHPAAADRSAGAGDRKMICFRTKTARFLLHTEKTVV